MQNSSTKLYKGELYNDDRLFILDYGIADEDGKQVWYVTTRRNTPRFPPYRVDRFASESEVIDFIKKIEPETPRISLEGKGPFPVPTYEEHVKWLHENQIPSSLEIHEINRGPVVKVSLTDLGRELINRDDQDYPPDQGEMGQ